MSKFKHYENFALYLTDANKLVNNASVKKILTKYGMLSKNATNKIRNFGSSLKTAERVEIHWGMLERT
jgi:hypothetical protein